METVVLVVLMFINNPADAGSVAHIEFNDVASCNQAGYDTAKVWHDSKVVGGAKQSTISWGCFKKGAK